MKFPINFRSASVLLLLLAVIAAGCKKETEAPEKIPVSPARPENPEQTTLYTISPQQALPMQLITITSSDDIGNEMLIADIAGQPVELRKTADKQWSFLCPVLQTGTYAIKLDNRFNLNFSVAAYTPIKRPEQQFDMMRSEISQIRAAIEKSTVNNKLDLSNALDYLKSGLNEVLSNMNDTDKVQLAYYINSNGYDKPGFSDMINLNLPDSFLGKNSSYDPTDATNVFISDFAAARTDFITSSDIATSYFITPAPTLLHKGLGTISGIAAIGNLSALFKLIEQDMANLMSKSVSIDAFQKKTTTLLFRAGQPVETGFRSTFTNFAAKDKAMGVFPAMFAGVTEVNNKISLFYNAYKQIQPWFTSAQPAAPETLLNITGTTKTKIFSLNPNYISIQDVSNPDIRIDLITNGASVQLKASSSLKHQTNFTITIRYDQANVNNSITQTFDAVLLQ